MGEVGRGWDGLSLTLWLLNGGEKDSEGGLRGV